MSRQDLAERLEQYTATQTAGRIPLSHQSPTPDAAHTSLTARIDRRRIATAERHAANTGTRLPIFFGGRP